MEVRGGTKMDNLKTQDAFIDKVRRYLEVFIVKAQYEGAFTDIPETALPQAISGMIDAAKEKAFENISFLKTEK